jgi:predicted Zn finger-like uncharacterized protein
MHISCPKCSTKFHVDSQAFGDVIRKVKCSKCQHLWNYQLEILEQNNKQMPEDRVANTESIFYSNNSYAQEKNEEETRFRDTPRIHLPMLIDVARPHVVTYQAPIISGLIIILSVLLFSNSVYEKYFFKSKYLQIQQVVLETGENQLKVRYLIKNNSKYKISLPPITTKLLDSEENIIKSITDQHKNLAIPAGQLVNIETIFTQTPDNAYKVNIDMKNNFNIF